MILVTGANGQLGRRIVTHLAARLAASSASQPLAVSVRDASKAQDLADRGITVRTADFDQPDTLAAAFAGVDRLVLVSTDGPKDIRIRQHGAAIRAATAAGVKHIVYTSFLDADAASPAEFAQVHAATEAELRASGLRLTILRNTLYSDFLPMTFGGALQTGVLHLPTGDGRASYLSRDELAEATAAAAVAPQPTQEVYELTGPEAVDSATLAAIVSRVTGKPIRYEPVAEADYAKALEGFGLPGWLAVAMGNMYTAVAEGRFAKVTGDFARLTGHAPQSVEAQVAALFGH